MGKSCTRSEAFLASLGRWEAVSRERSKTWQRETAQAALKGLFAACIQRSNRCRLDASSLVKSSAFAVLKGELFVPTGLGHEVRAVNSDCSRSHTELCMDCTRCLPRGKSTSFVLPSNRVFFSSRHNRRDMRLRRNHWPWHFRILLG